MEKRAVFVFSALFICIFHIPVFTSAASDRLQPRKTSHEDDKARPRLGNESLGAPDPAPSPSLTTFSFALALSLSLISGNLLQRFVAAD